MAYLLTDTTGQETFEYKCGVEELQEEVLTRMDALQAENNELQEKIETMEGTLMSVEEKVDNLEGKLEYLTQLLEKVIAHYTVKPAPLVDEQKNSSGPQWIGIQRRGQFGNPTNFFARSMDEYKIGFGNMTGEFWLGLDELARLTKDGKWEMQVDLVDYAGKTYTGIYHKFRVGAGPRYELEVGEYDSSKSTMGFDVFRENNKMAFSTKDVDQDTKSGDCSNKYGQGGWWYSACYDININGQNTGNAKVDNKGMAVYPGQNVMMKETEMKMKKKM
eukprot:GFUD01014069.1.p1 GENE.GFUD01014069.1~~GFUD01014069.1.p1  ORF type:complete len:303 (+),score=112.10 GFUD01014069.1:87-911(+)